MHSLVNTPLLSLLLMVLVGAVILLAAGLVWRGLRKRNDQTVKLDAGATEAPAASPEARAVAGPRASTQAPRVVPTPPSTAADRLEELEHEVRRLNARVRKLEEHLAQRSDFRPKLGLRF